MKRKNKYADVRLTEQELTDMSMLFKGVWDVEENAQCINIDGPVYVADILEAADFIRSKKFKYWRNPNLARKENQSVNGWIESIIEECAKLPPNELKHIMTDIMFASERSAYDDVRRNIRVTF